jgi:uncharacterized protein (AIM24 family)
LDVRNVVSDSGWTAAPRLRDMTEFQFGQSICQVEGEIVPVADVALGAGDTLYFEHHVLLWKDERVHLSTIPLDGAMKRLFAGMPFVITQAMGVGHIAFSRDATDELVVLPLHPGQELDVREHAFLMASGSVKYSYMRVKGLVNILFGGEGMFMERFSAPAASGLLLLHGYGNVFQRMLKPRESILVEPGGFLYKDASVTMNTEMQNIGTGLLGGTGLALARLTGPGRVGIQSMYKHHKT